MAITPPIFVDDNGDLSIFLSVEDAALYLEPEDLEPGQPPLRVYDSEGRLMRPVHLPPDGWFERTLGLPGRKMDLLQVDFEPQHAVDLAILIRRFLGYMRYPAADLNRTSLQQLVEMSKKHATGC